MRRPLFDIVIIVSDYVKSTQTHNIPLLFLAHTMQFNERTLAPVIPTSLSNSSLSKYLQRNLKVSYTNQFLGGFYNVTIDKLNELLEKVHYYLDQYILPTYNYMNEPITPYSATWVSAHRSTDQPVTFGIHRLYIEPHKHKGFYTLKMLPLDELALPSNVCFLKIPD